MLEEAYKALRQGRAVMIYDASDREGEVDLVYHASLITPEKIAVLREDAGGLICFSTSNEVRKALGLPFMNELLEDHPGLALLASKRLGYGDPPAFTLWVNHVSSVTGIRDPDRALTARRLGEIVGMVVRGGAEEARRIFYDEFMAPGHLPILASRGLSRRRGHTELSVALALLAGLTPAMVFAEMLVRGGVLGLEEARRLSRVKGIPLVTGAEIVEEALRRGVGL